MADTKNQPSNSKTLQAAMPSAAEAFTTAFVTKLQPGRNCPGFGKELPNDVLCPPGCLVLKECLAAMGVVR